MKSSITLQNITYVTRKTVDIVIKEGIIANITNPYTATSSNAIDCSCMYVSSGWIDLHVHAFAKLDPYGDDIDVIGISQGVTTIVDAGSCGADQFPMFVKEQIKQQTNVLAFLNVSAIGLQRIDELSVLHWIDQAKVIETYINYKHHIVGLKVRMSKSVVGNNGIIPLKSHAK